MIILTMLLQLTGPGGQPIEMNVDQIVSMREPRSADHFGEGVHCLVFTTDGKFTGVVETCKAIKQAIGAPR
jgi:hypothetical protein